MALISFDAIKKMLSECAPGHRMELKTHAWHVFYGGLSYRALPKYPEIEEFHVRKLGRTLKISECVKKFFGW